MAIEALRQDAPEHPVIQIKPIRTGWYRAWAGAEQFSRAMRTDVSWIADAARVWQETRGSMTGFDQWVSERIMEGER